MLNRRNISTLSIAAMLAIGAAGCEYDATFDPNKTEGVGQVSEGIAPAISAGEATPDEVIALSQPATETMDWLKVDSTAFAHNQGIPARFADAAKNEVPPLKWSDAPRGTQSFAVIIEDPDAQNPRPFVHLIAYNIAANDTSLTNQEVSRTLANHSDDMILGRNSAGGLGYVALSPPNGEAHTYHFQVFALDSTLNLGTGAEKQELLDAMNGHVIAKGETIGTFQRK